MTATNRFARQQLTAGFLSSVILLFALILLWLGQRGLSQLHKPVLEIRTISLVQSPPPQPPPPVVEQVEQAVHLDLAGPGNGVQLPLPKVQPKINLPSAPVLHIEQRQWQSLDIDWQAVELSELDGLPSLLTPLRIRFPKSLSRKGITRVLVKLDVVIDPQGQLELVSIVENQHPELQPELLRLVRDSRFSPPQKNGQAVRARFIWPVEIKP